MQLGDHAGAVSCLDRGTRMDLNSNTAACLYAGSALQRLDRHAESIIRFDRAIRPEPQHADGYILKGKSLAKLGGRNGAISCLDRAIRPELDNAHAHRLRGEILLSLGRDKQAKACLDRPYGWSRAMRMQTAASGTGHPPD